MSDTAPRRLRPDDPALPDLLALVRTSFAYMDGRIDPPSSMHRLGLADIAATARAGEVWCIGAPPCACVFLTVSGDALHLGKLAVDAAHRGRGLARDLVRCAEARARAQGLAALELQTRIELVENHAAFARLGFVRVGETSHPGYDRATSIRMRKDLCGPDQSRRGGWNGSA